MPCVVLVTGGNGFLGQHVVKHLRTKTDFIDEIRVLDLAPFTQKLEYDSEIPVRSYAGSILDTSVVLDATQEVDCVINCAGVVDVRLKPDEQKLYKINVKGTETLLQVCVTQNVNKFVHVSSVDTVIGADDILDGSEETLAKPKSLFFGKYAESKQQGEEIVRLFNGHHIENGNGLQTVSLRPITMYGELDPHFVTQTLRVASSSGGTLYRYGCGAGLSQFGYVGNVAWGVVCAYLKMRQDKEFGGKAFFLTDDTPTSGFFQFLEPYFVKCGYKLSTISIPYWVMYFIVMIMQFVAILLSPVCKLEPPITMTTLRFCSMRVTFSYNNARKTFGYKPLYSADSAFRLSSTYYTNWLAENMKI